MRLALVTVALTALLGSGESALACVQLGPPMTEYQLFLRASAVFIARVVRTEEKLFKPKGQKNPIRIIEADFRVIDVLKGKVPADAKVRDEVSEPGNCGIGLSAGMDFLFFINEGEENFVSKPSGSKRLMNKEDLDAAKSLRRVHRYRSMPAIEPAAPVPDAA